MKSSTDADAANDLCDEDLIDCTTATIERKLTILFSRHQQRLLAESVRALNGDWHAAEDVVQRAWVRAYSSLASFDRNLASFGGWLRCIRDRLLFDHVKGARLRRALQVKDQIIDDHHSEGISADDRRELLDAVAALPTEIREPVTKIYLDDMSMFDAAAELSVPLSTLHGRAAKGLRLLREKLGAPDAIRVRRQYTLSRREVQMLVA